MALSKPQMDFSQMDLVTCPLCSEVYKSPKTLPCLHSFCEKCIRDFIISIGKTKGEDNKLVSFNCPLCRTVVRPNDSSLGIEKWAASLPGNISAEMVIAEAEGKKLDCILCKRGLNRTIEATHLCCQCDELMCNNCGQTHRASRACSDHHVVLISDAGLRTGGIYFNAIQGTRCFHQVKQYCSDHKELFCNVCTDLKHKKCTNITSTALGDRATADELCNSLPVNLSALKETFEQMIQERTEIKEGLRTHVQGVENEVKAFVETVKSRLDDLFEAFRKELCVFHEEENTKINVKLRLLEQFVKTLEHWIKVSRKLKGNATETQILVLLETIKSQIDISVKEIRTSMHEEATLHFAFERAKLISEVKNVESLGSLGVSKEKKDDQTDIIYMNCKRIGLFAFPTFDDILVKHHKQIRIPNANLSCGVSIDQHHALVGLNGIYRLQIVNLTSGTVVSTTTFSGYVTSLRLYFDKDSNDSNKVFISNSGYLYTANINDNKISDPVMIGSNNTDYVGGMCVIEDNVYVAVINNAIKSFWRDVDPRTTRANMSECFKTNTSYQNGLESYDGNLIYTTTNQEIKCSSVRGEKIFCYKSPYIASPKGLAILPRGSIVVLDTYTGNGGKLHLVSADGRKHRTLLEKFENVTAPQDVWLAEDKKTMYVCGGDVIDVYTVLP